MDKKLTDSEIIKALECCIIQCSSCKQCPLLPIKDNRGKCYTNLKKQAIDLINRLQEEIARKDKIYIDLLKTSSERADIISSLQAENERLKKAIQVQEIMLENQDYTIKRAKAEAYKECIEKAKSEIDSQSHSRSLEASGERFRIHKILDNLLKETVGENNG